MTCIFCRIVANELPAAVVYQDPHCLGFLDQRPLFPGHVLLVPRAHVETLTDLAVEEVAPLFTAAQRIATAVQQAMQAQGTFVAMNNTVSQSVPHLHVHIVPRSKGDGLKGFFWPRHQYRDERHKEEVRRAIAALLL
jgi:histidine triad (HIT) family protein